MDKNNVISARNLITKGWNVKVLDTMGGIEYYKMLRSSYEDRLSIEVNGDKVTVRLYVGRGFVLNYQTVRELNTLLSMLKEA